jgi:hypothetical protein
LDLATQRALRLQATVRYASYWLMGQGGLYLLVGDRLSGWLRLRYEPVMDPYLRLAGLSLLCLGFFLLKSLRDARRQYLAVDTLILYFLGRVFFLLNYRLAYHTLTWFEWLGGLADAGLGGGLVWFRTRSSEMQAAGTLLAGRAVDLARGTQAWIKKQGPAPTVTLGDLDIAPDPVPTPVPVPEVPLPPAAIPPPPSGAEEKKNLSEAVPHMD